MTAIRIVRTEYLTIEMLFERIRAYASQQYTNNTFARAPGTATFEPENPFVYPDNEMHALMTAVARMLSEQLSKLEITIDDAHIDQVDVQILERAATWLALKVIERTPKIT